ncbi:MAG: chorismate mutase [Clostridia bacterium]|nr:chorismate mutase [Clostridia bacterium]
MADNLELYREKIDEIDTQLISLMEERMDAAKHIGEIKLKTGASVLDEKREQIVLASRMEKVSSREYAGVIEDFFKSVMALSRGIQQRLIDSHQLKESLCGTAVYQGVDGGYGSIAAEKIFGDTIYNVKTFENVFEEVEAGRADYGVVPIENSTTGSITDVVDILTRGNLYIVGETSIKVEHNLMAPRGVGIEDITEVYSHEQGFSQCKEFLKDKPWVQNVVLNTALGAQMASRSGRRDVAAIASKRAAKLYDLEILCPSINSGKDNATRFIVVAKNPVVGELCTKAAISFSVPHVSGSLVSALEILAKHEVNVTKIESRPVVDRFEEYRFFAELEGNISDEKIKDALDELKRYAISYKYLGNYKKI